MVNSLRLDLRESLFQTGLRQYFVRGYRLVLASSSWKARKVTHLQGGLKITFQGTHGTGKTGKMAQKLPCQRKPGNLEILSKHREFCQNTGKHVDIFFAQVVNALILKVKDIAIFAGIFFFSRSWMGLPSQFSLCNSHKLCKLAKGKFVVRQGKHREFENTI